MNLGFRLYQPQPGHPDFGSCRDQALDLPDPDRLDASHLGWFGGVSLWIVLWWLLAVLVWKDLAYRLEARLR